MNSNADELVTTDRNAPRRPLAWSASAAALSVALGGRVFRFVATHPQLRLRLSDRFELFRVSDQATPDCTVRWSAGAVIAPTTGIVLQETAIWETRLMPDGSEQTTFFAGERRRPYLCLRFQSGFRTADIVQVPEAGNGNATPELHPLSEFLTTRVLAHAGRVEVHGSAAVINEKAVVFVGHSGAGKTTIAQIAERSGAVVLSDDRVILGMENGRAFAWGTPWHGSGWYTAAGSSPLAAVFLLRQSEVDRVTPMRYADGVKELFVRLIQVRVRTNEVLESHVVLENILRAIPAYEFCFRPTLAAFALALRAIDV